MTRAGLSHRDWTKAGLFVGLTALGMTVVVAIAAALIFGWFGSGSPTRWIVSNATAGEVFARLDVGGQPGQTFGIGPGETRLLPALQLGTLELLDADCAMLDRHDPVTVPPLFLIAKVDGSTVTYTVDDKPGELTPAAPAAQCSAPAS